jgi:hypothetical protein
VAKPTLELADVLHRHGEAYRQDHAGTLNRGALRVLRALEICRTATLGGHVDACDSCGHRRISYNSCRNRHCPKCQALARAEWLEARKADLLPVSYFHVVFTVPEEVAEVALHNKDVVYGILFRAAARTLKTIAADPRHLGAEIGFVAVLHTWGQTLQHHPHLHCVVPGGGLAPDGERRIGCQPGFFLPVKVLSRLFRRLFLEQLDSAFASGQLRFSGSCVGLAEPGGFAGHLAPVRTRDWVVYAKPPFGGPEQVLEYLGRYTHRVAIANHRLVDLVDGRVRFHWKDYRHHDKRKVMSLTADEFIRRFLLHVLPDGFARIRHCGLLGNRGRAAKLAVCRRLLKVPPPEPVVPAADYQERFERLTGCSLCRCPVCGVGTMVVIEIIPATTGRSRRLRIDTS